jgi:hypothetical protein
MEIMTSFIVKNRVGVCFNRCVNEINLSLLLFLGREMFFILVVLNMRCSHYVLDPILFYSL